jgi:Pyruvate/2-oxoglutarate dehydrogenase complex, dihydrolipoamide dehydrogenase (E3) component, and related enzymes
MIAEAALAIEMGATLEDVADTIHPHPTFSESVQEAAEAALGRPIHYFYGKMAR